MYRSLVLVGAACAFSATAHAGDVFEIKPGKWKTEVTMKMSVIAHGMNIDQPARTSSHEYCVTPEESNFSPEDFANKLNQSSKQGDMQCDVTDVKSNHPRLSYTVKCSMQGMDMIMENEYTVSADGLSGTGSGTSSFEGDGMTMNSTANTTQTYLGTC